MAKSIARATHIVVGTKAQFIKMAPIARVLEDRGWPYRLLDLGQHGSITLGILNDFGLQPDHVHVLPAGKTVATYGQAARWVTAAVARILSSRTRLREALLRPPPGYALIHGDTLSTLLGLYLSRRLEMKVGLVEAGLTSGNLLDPFPEEMIRRHVEKRVDLLFAPDALSAGNLAERQLPGQIVNTRYNTGRDALQMIQESRAATSDNVGPSGTLLTLHRAETLSRPDRLRSVVEHVVRLADHLAPINFYLHRPTEIALAKAGLLEVLKGDQRFKLRALAPYPEFLDALASARFVLTDGGSIQEEVSYLGKPCLLLRRSTERPHGIGTTAALTSMQVERDIAFLRSFESRDVLRSSNSDNLDASRCIVDTLSGDSRRGAADN